MYYLFVKIVFIYTNFISINIRKYPILINKFKSHEEVIFHYISNIHPE